MLTVGIYVVREGSVWLRMHDVTAVHLVRSKDFFKWQVILWSSFLGPVKIFNGTRHDFWGVPMHVCQAILLSRKINCIRLMQADFRWCRQKENESDWCESIFVERILSTSTAKQLVLKIWCSLLNDFRKLRTKMNQKAKVIWKHCHVSEPFIVGCFK